MVEPAEGTWIDWLRKIPGEAKVEIVPPDHPESQRAVLHYRTLGQTPHGSWLEIELETGRMHQIRVQAASRGWPVLGDAQYESRQPFGPQVDDTRQRAIALHARQISFVLPQTQEPSTFIAADAAGVVHARHSFVVRSFQAALPADNLPPIWIVRIRRLLIGVIRAC